MDPRADCELLPLSIAMSSESSPVKLVDKPMLNWKSKLVVSLVVSPSIAPRTVSTLNDAVVVYEKLPASKLFNLASKPSTRLLVTAISSAALKSLIVTSFAVAAIGANRPNDAGATSKLLKSFINFLTRNLKYTSR